MTSHDTSDIEVQEMDDYYDEIQSVVVKRCFMKAISNKLALRVIN